MRLSQAMHECWIHLAGLALSTPKGQCAYKVLANAGLWTGTAPSSGRTKKRSTQGRIKTLKRRLMPVSRNTLPYPGMQSYQEYSTTSDRRVMQQRDGYGYKRDS